MSFLAFFFYQFTYIGPLSCLPLWIMASRLRGGLAVVFDGPIEPRCFYLIFPPMICPVVLVELPLPRWNNFPSSSSCKGLLSSDRAIGFAGRQPSDPLSFLHFFSLGVPATPQPCVFVGARSRHIGNWHHDRPPPAGLSFLFFPPSGRFTVRRHSFLTRNSSLAVCFRRPTQCI